MQKGYKSQLRTCVLICLSHVQLFATLWTVAHHAPLSVGFSRHEYWSGLPFPFPGDLPEPGIKATPLMSPALAGSSLLLAPPGKSLKATQWSKEKAAKVNDTTVAQGKQLWPKGKPALYLLL